jgi:DNA-binding NarL/FixJ family response regulator
MKVTDTSSNVASLRKDAAALVAERPHWLESDAMTHHHRQAPHVLLTPRQLEVLSLLCEGLPNKLICRQLNIATGTVKVHISVILRELGVSSRLQAVVAAQRCGLVGKSVVSTPGQATGFTPAALPAITAGASGHGTLYRLTAAA